MTCRQYEAVAIAPDRGTGVEAQELLPDRVHDRRQRHWCARVAGVGGLDRVHAERTDGVDRELVDGIAFQGRKIRAGGLGHGSTFLGERPGAGSESAAACIRNAIATDEMREGRQLVRAEASTQW